LKTSGKIFAHLRMITVMWCRLTREYGEYYERQIANTKCDDGPSQQDC
jgi:hypothetical protein